MAVAETTAAVEATVAAVVKAAPRAEAKAVAEVAEVAEVAAGKAEAKAVDAVKAMRAGGLPPLAILRAAAVRTVVEELYKITDEDAMCNGYLKRI